MKATLRVALGALVSLGLFGCATFLTSTPEERQALEVNLDGLKLGDKPSALARFAQTQLIPYGRPEFKTYEIYNPNPQISTAVAYFYNGRLKKLELRYYDSATIHTLTRAGGWAGLRNYLVSRFGNPSRVGPDIPLETYVGGLQPKYAQFNGEWIFSRVNRKVNYIAFSDHRGGLALITFTDTTPIPTTPTIAQPTPTPKPVPQKQAPVVQQAPNPGF